MKKFLISSCVILLSSIMAILRAGEPDFIGEAIYVDGQGDTLLLDKEISSIKVTALGSLTSLTIQGTHAQTQIPEGKFNLIVRAQNNAHDPLAVVTIYKFDIKSKERRAKLSFVDEDGVLTSKTYTQNQMKFTGKKYGKSSYLLTMNLSVGEYGILVRNPENKDEKSNILSCFSVIPSK